MLSYAFDFVVAPFWICLVLSIYALTLGGLVWRLMVGTILVFTVCIGGFSVHAFFEGSGYWPLPMVIGGPITLIALLMLWYFRSQGDPLINSNSWRAALVFLVPLGAILLLMGGYKSIWTHASGNARSYVWRLVRNTNTDPRNSAKTRRAFQRLIPASVTRVGLDDWRFSRNVESKGSASIETASQIDRRRPLWCLW